MTGYITLADVKKYSNKVFKKYYLVQMPEQQARSVSELRVKAYRYSNNEAHNRGMAGRLVKKYFCIDDIAKSIEMGHSVSMCKAKDRLEVYDVIQEYLGMWENLPLYEVSAGRPEDHLRRLDGLAEKIYERLGLKITEDIIDMNSVESIITGGSINTSIASDALELKDAEGKRIPKKAPERVSAFSRLGFSGVMDDVATSILPRNERAD